jgi:Nickel/cobalt transporter regulator
VIGQPLPPTVVYQPLPAPLAAQLPPPPPPYSYVQVDNDVLLMNTSNRMIADMITDLSDFD